MTHGDKHQDYGTVGVIIDNQVIQDSIATAVDIVMTPGITGNLNEYSAEGLENYQATIVAGDDYYRVAAARAADPKSIAYRSRGQLFEVKAPSVPNSAVKGFVVYDDLDEAVRLRDKLAERGITGKVLFVNEPHRTKTADYLQRQLKTMQETGDWDDVLAVEKEAESGSGETFVLDVGPRGGCSHEEAGWRERCGESGSYYPRHVQ